MNIAARTLPAPEDVSEDLQNSIAGTPTPDLQAVRQNFPKNDTEWEALKGEMGAAWTAQGAALAEQHAVSIRRDSIESVEVHHVMPADIDPQHENHLFVYLHGGGYVVGGGDASLPEAVLIADRVRIPVLSIDYRMAPRHPFPAAIHDVVTVYEHLLRQRSAKSIALGGSSAGGGLTFASVHKFIDLGLEVPGVLYGGTPASDLTKTGDSLFINEGIDRSVPTWDGLVDAAHRLYAGDHDRKDPLISPVYGDFEGFSPTYLITGTRDLLMSATVRIHRKLRAAGVVAELNVYEGMSHWDYVLLPESPESKQVYAELDEFVLQHLGQ